VVGRSGGFGSSAAALAAGLLLRLIVAGCAGSTNAQAVSSSLVRARPTTPPETYALQMDAAVATLRDSLGRLSVLLLTPRYFDNAWKSEAIDQSTLVELGYRQVEGLTPPDKEQAKHAEALQALQDCQTLTVYVYQGINNLDKGPFDEITKRVASCRDQLDQALGATVSIEAQIQTAGAASAGSEVHARAKRGVNLRSGPGTNFSLAATAREGDTFTVTGRTQKSDWLQVTGEKVQSAWIAVFLVQADGDLNSVPVINQANP
jgi:hypothetical protein